MATINDLKNAILKVIQDDETRRKLALQARDIIYKRVKSGYGVDSDEEISPRKTKLLPLSDKYKEDRRKTKLGPFGAPTRSNLTLSGQMLESMKGEPIPNGIRVYIPSTARTSITIADRVESTHLNNRQLAEKVAEQGRPFLAMTEDEQRIIASEIDKIITKNIKGLR